MKDYKKYIIIGSFVVLIVLGAILINGLLNKPSNTKEITTNEVKTTLSTNTTTSKEYIIVEIKGEVYYPGVYEFEKDEVVVQDVINMAGGLTKKADVSLLNLARVVENHSSIIIGSYDTSSYILNENESFAKININTCTIDELITLDGIGEAKAKSIIQYRKTNGFFTSIDDIKKVDGIGDALFEKIKDYIMV